jgi:hypothetical protein
MGTIRLDNPVEIISILKCLPVLVTDVEFILYDFAVV